MLNLLSLDEAAKEIKVSLHTIRAWVFQRRFETLKIGRRRMVERETLERFVRSGVIRRVSSKRPARLHANRDHRQQRIGEPLEGAGILGPQLQP